MIIRILGEGQYRVADAEAHAAINAGDDAIEAAVESGDQQALATALQQLHDLIVEHGSPLADDELTGSDVIIPATDASLDEVRDLLSDEGLIPNTQG